MGLTAEVELALQDTELDKFFDKNKKAFKEIAERSYEFAHDNIKATGLPLRRDDVAKSVKVALETNESFRECLERKKLRQKFWYVNFADLIVERLWEDLENGYKTKQPKQP